jgi:hypothetical protein
LLLSSARHRRCSRAFLKVEGAPTPVNDVTG